jgi:hypothetical protein
MKFPAAPDLAIAVLQGRRCIREQRGQARLTIDERPRHQILAVDVEKIEQEEHETGGVAGIGCQLDHAERGDAVGAHAAQLAVEIGLARAER